jgi:hypothetical protein
MRKRIIVLVALAGLVAVVVAVTAFASSSSKRSGVVSASPTTTQVVGGNGWQADFNYNVPTGIGGLFFHYPCPGAKVADGGKFVVDFGSPSANSIHLIGEGVRTDIAGLHEWAWWINWSGAAAPAGTVITFNVHCGRN